MLRFPSFASLARLQLLIAVIAIGCSVPHSGKHGESVGSSAEAVSFGGVGNPANVLPGLNCVTNDVASGHLTAVFSATNTTSSTIVVPLGPTNTLSLPPLGSGQPTSFAPGTQYFTVGFASGKAVTWTLGTSSVTASGSTPACTVTPGPLGLVVQIGATQVPIRLDPAQVLADAIQPTETDAPGLTVGATPGTFTVTPDGQASYVVDLFIPPGRITPNLKLVYGSGSGQSIFGVGWQLSGLSQIRRCPRTIALDRGAGPIDFSNDDAVCLDGRRLVNIGANELRPENDNFTRVVTDDARSKYTVFQRDGRVLEFGATPNSRLTGTRRVWQDDPIFAFTDQPNAVYAWALSSIRDRNGNSIVMSYRPVVSGPDQRFNELLPTKIAYSPGRTIDIKYDDEEPQADGRHPSPSYRFVSGLGIASTRVVTRLRMSGPNPVTSALLREYKLQYNMNASVTHRPLLLSVQECDAAQVCLGPTTFDWDEGSNRFTDTVIPNTAGLGAKSTLIAGDFNGDGRDDIYLRRDDGSGELRFGTNDGLSGPVVDTAVHFKFSSIQPIDLFMNGQVELAFIGGAIGGGQGTIFRFDGAHLEPLTDIGPLNSFTFVADLNGDGRPEFLTTGEQVQDWSFRLNLGKGQFSPFAGLKETKTNADGTKSLITFEHRPHAESYVAVVDASGRNAMLIANMGTAQPLDADGGSAGPPQPLDRDAFYAVVSATTHPTSANSAATDLHSKGTLLPVGSNADAASFHYLMVDINGDGNADVLRVPNLGGQPLVALNNGSNFETPVPAVGTQTDMVAVMEPMDTATRIATGVQTADWNQDGVSDVLQLGATGTPRVSVTVYTATRALDFHEDILRDVAGNAIPAADSIEDTTGPHGSPLAIVLDSDGNGLVDFIQLVGGQLHLYRHAGNKADQIKGISEGQGKTVEINYLSMTDDSAQGTGRNFQIPVYTPEICTYPEYCVRRGMWLVESFKVTADHDRTSGDRKRTLSFKYKGAKTDLEGHGFIGMTSRTVKDEQTGSVVTTVYDNEPVTGLETVGYPKAGLPKAEMVATPLSLVATDTTQWRVTTATYAYDVIAQTSTQTDPHAPYNVLGTRTERKVLEIAVQDLKALAFSHIGDPGVVDPTTVDGAGPPNVLSDDVTTYDSYDDFDNLTKSTTTSKSGEVQIYRGTYANALPVPGDPLDADRYILGMQTRSEVTSQTPSGAQKTRVVTYVPDQHNGLVKIMTIQPDTPLAEETSTTTYDRNSFGQAIRITSTAVDPLDATPMTRTQTFGYDDGDGVFPSSATNGMGHTTRMLYHPGLGVLGFEIDPNAVKTRLQYDTFGRPRTRATDGQGPVTFNYHAPAAVDGVSILLTEGVSVHVEKVGGGAQTAFYNGLGHPYATLARSTTTAPSVVITSYTGVRDGEVASVSRPFFPSLTQSSLQLIEYDYDTLGRLVDQKLPNGSITKYAYSGVTRVVSDPKGNDTETVFDDLGRIASVSEIVSKQQGLTPAQAVETDYGYGPFSDVEEVSISHALRIGQPALTLLRTTHMTHDDLGRRKHLDDPDSGISDRVYNAFGEIAQEQLGDPLTMPAAQIERIVYTRDQIGRVVAEAPSSQGPNTFQWDTAPLGIGRLASSLSSDGIVRGYSYDSSGRLSQERWTIDQPDPYVVDYRYDDFGRILALFYPTVSGQSERFAVSYHYDPTGVVDAACNAQGKFFLACDPSNAIWRADLRQADGQLTEETFANGEVTDRSYTDPRGFLTKIETTLGAVKNQSLSYTYDLNGNIGTRTEVVPAEGGGAGTVTSETFAYDALNRLARWDQTFQKTTLSYDDVGNFTSRVVTAGTTETSRLDYSFVAGATPHADLVVSGTRYSFDGKGRNTRVGSEWNASREITYTPFDLPKQIDVSGGSQRWTFQYDAEHKRVRKKDWWRFSLTVGDLYEKNQDWDGLRHLFYIHGAERTVAELEIDPNGKSSFLYLHDDHLGSVHSTTDQTGTVTRFTYDIFGARTPSQSRDMRRGFTFHALDDDITEQASDPGLINMKGRVYDPKIGRFMTADPIVSSPYGSQAYNRYGYVLNNPLSFIDPTGFANEGGQGGWPMPETNPFSPPPQTQQEPSKQPAPSTPPTTTGGAMEPAPAPVPVPISPQPGPPGPMPGPITGGPPGGAGAQGPVSDSNGPRQTPMGQQEPNPRSNFLGEPITATAVVVGMAVTALGGAVVIWWHLPSTQKFMRDLKARMKPKPKEDKVLPQRDQTGKIHDPLPDHVPDDWSPDDMEDVERELEESIKRRAGEQQDLGEDPAHRQQIGKEEDFLRKVQKALEDARPKGGT